MLHIDHNGIYRSTLMDEHGFASHGFTTRRHGDMRNPSKQIALLARLNLTERPFIFLRQIHSDVVWDATSSKNWTIQREGDAVLYTQKNSNSMEEVQYAPVLSVHTADCVPILLADKANQILAVVHAGWRGTLQSITKKVVVAMKNIGSREIDIIACIGPSIGPCCYIVPDDRAESFKNVFAYKDQLQRKKNKWILDLRVVNFGQMRDMGLVSKHIDWHPPCTSCRNDEFFSYRKDSNGSYGEMIGFITM